MKLSIMLKRAFFIGFIMTLLFLIPDMLVGVF
jgi:flagellar biosynthesis protein FliP